MTLFVLCIYVTAPFNKPGWRTYVLRRYLATLEPIIINIIIAHSFLYLFAFTIICFIKLTVSLRLLCWFLRFFPLYLMWPWISLFRVSRWLWISNVYLLVAHFLCLLRVGFFYYYLLVEHEVYKTSI